MFSNETKIGFLAIVAIALLLWGYKYVKGKNILKKSNYLYVQYDDVNQLATSTPVVIQGVQVGIVSDIYFKAITETRQVVEVVLDIESGIGVPKDTRADIIATGFMGGKAVVLNFKKPCKGNDCAQNGDYIQGKLKGLMSSMLGDSGEMGDYMTAIEENIGGIVDTLKTKISGSGEGEGKLMSDVNEILNNLKSATANLDILLRKSSGKIDGLLANMESITDNISSSNAQIKGILQNAESFTGELDRMDIDKTIGKANIAIDGASQTMQKLQGTLSNADQAAKDLSGLLTKVGGTEGTLGMLINDPSLHNSLEQTLTQLNALMQDIRLHPERYRRILSKKTAKYEKPEKDPLLEK